MLHAVRLVKWFPAASQIFGGGDVKTRSRKVSKGRKKNPENKNPKKQSEGVAALCDVTKGRFLKIAFGHTFWKVEEAQAVGEVHYWGCDRWCHWFPVGPRRMRLGEEPDGGGGGGALFHIVHYFPRRQPFDPFTDSI